MHRQAIRQGFSLVKPIVWLLLCLVLFYACEEQLGSSLLLFAQRYVERGNIPAATLQAINPLTILLMGVVLSVFLKKRRWGDIKKLAVSFTLLGSAFFMLALCGYSLGGFVLALIMLSIGELFMGPTVLSSVAKKAPEGMQGFFMGSVTVGFSAASLFGGTLSRLILADPEGASLLSYQKGFVMIGCLACLGIVLMIRMYMLQRREEDADPSIVEG
ncbi:MAG: hypothetical protein FJZ58_06805 [Chlamydiae bacterium]|nr:hypothetical protein [Chlamydiota bacterium]